MPLKNTQKFGMAPNGEIVEIAEIKGGDLTVKIMSWGASVQDVRVDGIAHSLVLGSDNFEAYLTSMKYFGATAGPIANRICNGELMIAGEQYQLEKNENSIHTLHGGSHGTSNINWQFIEVEKDSCKLSCHYNHLEIGLPAQLDITAEYQIKQDNILEIIFSATADRLTLCNLAHHSYWNLDGSSSLNSHQLQVFAKHYLPIDDENIPLEKIEAVENTRFDFQNLRSICYDGEVHLDHNFCLEMTEADMHPACLLQTSDVALALYTSEPGLQIYDGLGINTKPFLGHQGMPYAATAGIALEPQKWPDAPNHLSFPSIEINRDKAYLQRSQFHIRKRHKI